MLKGAPRSDVNTKGDFGCCSRYIGVSRTTFSTLASSTVSFDKCSSAATRTAVICASCFCILLRTRRASDNRARSSSRSIGHQFALPNNAALLVLNMLSR